MSKRVIPIGLAASATACIPFVSYAEGTNLHINTGLWEVVSAPKMTGQLPVTEADLAQLPPERRAKMMAAMQAMLGTPHTYRECMTEEKRKKGFQLSKDDASCQRQIVSNTSSEMEIRETCNSQDEGLRNADIRFETRDPDQVTGTINMTVARGGKTMQIDNTITGHRLGSDCGKVDDAEMVK